MGLGQALPPPRGAAWTLRQETGKGLVLGQKRLALSCSAAVALPLCAGPAWALREEPLVPGPLGLFEKSLGPGPSKAGSTLQYHCCCATLYTSVACWAQPEPLWELPQEARWCSRPVEGTGTDAEAVRSCGKAAEHTQFTVSAGLAPKTCDGFNMNMGSSWHASMALSVPLAMHCPYLHRPSSPEKSLQQLTVRLHRTAHRSPLP